MAPKPLSIVHNAISRKLPVTPAAAATGLVAWMSTIAPESAGAPVRGSWYVEPLGSVISWPTRPCAQVWMPSTWSWKNMLSSSTSGYQRYWTNSVPAYCAAGCATLRAADSVTVLAVALIAVIVRISGPCPDWPALAVPVAAGPSVPRPTPMLSPTWNLATLDRCSTVAPTAAAAVSCGSSTLYGRTACS